MSVSPAPFLPQRYYDGNNVPLVGGKLFTYAAGTTTKQATYTDASGTTQNTNPIILNARGESPVFLDDSLSYKLVLAPAWDTDPPQAAIWTEDNITTADGGLRTALAAQTGVQLIGGMGIVVTPQQYAAKLGLGPLGIGTQDDSPAFVAAIAYLKSIAGNLVGGIHKASPKLYIPAGTYYLGTTTLDITHTLIIEGDGGNGATGGAVATKLKWAANTTGIRFQAYNTSGATNVGGSGFDAGLSMVCNIGLYGGFVSGGSVLEGEYHGIHAKTTVFLYNVTIESFQGDGFYAHTTIGAGSPLEGYSNSSQAYNCWFSGCRNGRSTLGGDANVMVFVGCQYLYNRACGVDEQCFLGNTEIGAHAAGNGITPDNTGTANFPAYVVSYSGNRYCVVQGQEAGASTNAPSGTTADNTWWYYLSAGVTATGIPAWTSGMTLRCGAPYRTNNANARNIFLNPYSEGGQGYEQFVAPTLIQGGLHGPGDPKGTGLYKQTSAGGSSAGEEISGALRLTGSNPNFGGAAGLELYMFSGTATVSAHDRNNAVDIPLALNGISASLQASGTTRVKADATGLGFYGAPTVAQPSGTGNTHTVAAGSTTNVFTNTTFDGSIGSTAYSVGDIVAALKSLGILKS